MSARSKSGWLYWLALLCLLLCVGCLFRWFGLAYEAGDAFEAAKAGALYTAADLAEFRAMGTIAGYWFDGAVLLLVGCVSLAFVASRVRRRLR